MCFKGIVFHHVFNDIMLFLEEVELCIDFMFFSFTLLDYY